MNLETVAAEVTRRIASTLSGEYACQWPFYVPDTKHRWG